MCLSGSMCSVQWDKGVWVGGKCSYITLFAFAVSFISTYTDML